MALSKSAAQGLARAKAAYSNMPLALTALIPEPTAENSQEFGKAIMRYDPQFNEYMHAVLNAVVTGSIRHAEDKNPYALTYRDMGEYGYTIQEIYADALNVSDWHACDTADYDDQFGVEPSRVYTCYHSINFQKRVKVSIPDNLIRRSFTSWEGVNDMISQVIRTLYTSMIGAECKGSENLLAIAHTGGFAYPLLVNSGLETTADGKTYIDERALAYNVKQEKAIAGRLSVAASRDYNFMGVSTLTNLDNILVFLTPEYLASQDVGVLAASFNMDKATFMGRVIQVPGYGGAENDGSIGFLCDEEWFKCFIKDRQLTNSYNAAKRVWNYFYFTDAIMSFSLMANCVELVDAVKPIENVTIDEGQSAVKGQNTTIKAEVTHSNEKGGWSSKLDWKIDGNKSKKTFISPSGILYVDPAETADTIKVTATSVQNTLKSDTKQVTIKAA